ncbi:MAG: hypothetical protein IPH28_22620 [Cytophagaceae bacterium]|nr:hypothetical protein [Cytophagaceae bacterium]
MGKAIILVNERANSFGETNIMALMAYCKNSILIGSNTSGSNGNVAICNLIGDIEIGLRNRFRFQMMFQLKELEFLQYFC